MEKIIEIKYKADCGRKFSRKSAAEKHETVCKCWTNPKHKTCKTCKFGRLINDSNGMHHEPQYLHTWREWECQNSGFCYDEHFTRAHEKAPDLNINCPLWVAKV